MTSELYSPLTPQAKMLLERVCIVTTVGVLRISRDRDDQRVFLSLKFFIPGFNWVGNIALINAFWEFLTLGNLTFLGC